jgi:hypothetical protein
MRWFICKNHSCEKFVKRWYALWPVTVKRETRWMEWVSVEYRRVFYVGKDHIKHGEQAVRFVIRLFRGTTCLSISALIGIRGRE